MFNKVNEADACLQLQERETDMIPVAFQHKSHQPVLNENKMETGITYSEASFNLAITVSLFLEKLVKQS
ncbi:hypothetical protein A0J61_00520 [Choanephora cucurbitarum]|uniref:Uncharacterized protein n=1 Tax=Choanephora cucurbitarum TaxID=101091 RepID=A0A1C7NSE7_9FUNG|nr:hypothetical protein A0J61_00520 [Choanephora cucurbitarum]